MMKLFGKLLLRLDPNNSEENQYYIQYMNNLMSMPAYMCRILLGLLNKEKLITSINIIHFFTLPAQTKNDNCNIVTNYKIIGDGFTEENFNQFLASFNLTDNNITFQDMQTRAVELGLYDGSQFNYMCYE